MVCLPASRLFADQKGRELPAYIVLDTQDPERLVQFYGPLQGVETVAIYGDDQYHALSPNQEGLMLVLQRVPEAKVGKNRAHFDIVVEDLDASTTRVEQLGGRWIEPGKTHELEGFQWRCMADPEDNEFCLYLVVAGPTDGPPAQLTD
jgi:predicted enzyme related to lactoylglutathione lyase